MRPRAIAQLALGRTGGRRSIPAPSRARRAAAAARRRPLPFLCAPRRPSFAASHLPPPPTPPGKKPPNRTPPGPGDKWEKGQELRKGGKASAPKNFGVMSGRRTLAPGEDLPGGTRVDPEGMVYALEDTGGGPDAVAGAYFCDRFRRYRFDTRASGLALLRGLVRAPALPAGPCLALSTGRALTLFTPLLWTTIHRPPNLRYSREHLKTNKPTQAARSRYS